MNTHLLLYSLVNLEGSQEKWLLEQIMRIPQPFSQHSQIKWERYKRMSRRIILIMSVVIFGGTRKRIDISYEDIHQTQITQTKQRTTNKKERRHGKSDNCLIKDFIYTNIIQFTNLSSCLHSLVRTTNTESSHQRYEHSINIKLRRFLY